jgi:HEAT repeat protein
LRPHVDLVPELLADLETKVEHRSAIILSLGKSQDERAFEPLVKLLKVDDYQTPGWAAKGLKYLADPRAEPHLIEAARVEGNGWLRVHACDALADLGTAAAIPVLEEIASDPRYTGALSVRATAQRALESVRNDR